MIGSVEIDYLAFGESCERTRAWLKVRSEMCGLVCREAYPMNLNRAVRAG